MVGSVHEPEEEVVVVEGGPGGDVNEVAVLPAVSQMHEPAASQDMHHEPAASQDVHHEPAVDLPVPQALALAQGAGRCDEEEDEGFDSGLESDHDDFTDDEMDLDAYLALV